jgi:hypothetical protein
VGRRGGPGNFPVEDPAGYLCSGRVGVAGSDATVSVASRPARPCRYPVTFEESGLPGGTAWGVGIPNPPDNGTNANRLPVELTNGSYRFAIDAPPGYVASPGSGGRVVAGTPLTRSVVFSQATPGPSRVTFSEAGSPAGVGWTVSASGATQAGIAGTSLRFSGRNGSYGFAIETASD